MSGPKIVKPAEILAGVQAGTTRSRLAGKLLRRIEPAGTPTAKVRLGFVVAFDATTWTVTALIGDQLTQVSGIPVLAGVVPVIECAGQFVQVGGDSTTEYTLLGMLGKGPGIIRIRKPADQSVTNSTVLQSDNDLRFYALAGRTYLFDIYVVVMKTGTEVVTDLKLGWIMPSGTTWSGGGPGPSTALTENVNVATQALETNNIGANWRAFSNVVGQLPYGVDASGRGVGIQFLGSLKVGATSGLCTVVWGQNGTPGGGITTTVKEGSYLKADMTSEYTL